MDGKNRERSSKIKNTFERNARVLTETQLPIVRSPTLPVIINFGGRVIRYQKSTTPPNWTIGRSSRNSDRCGPIKLYILTDAGKSS